MFLGGQVYPFSIRKPGAHHNARFLATTGDRIRTSFKTILKMKSNE